MAAEPVTVQEARRVGNEELTGTRGPDHYSQTGALGGRRLSEERDRMLPSQIARRGAAATLERRRLNHYRAVGRKGGARARELIEKAMGEEE